MQEFVLKARPRGEFGTKAAVRLRERGLLPANVYGHGESNVMVSLDTREFTRFFEQGHRIATIQIEGGSQEHGVVKEVQYDAFGSEFLHVDFARVRRGEIVSMEVPIEVVGVPKGAAGGGVMEFRHKELRIEGPAGEIPESVALNVEDLVVGQSLRVHDVTPPKGCKILDDPDIVVIAIGESHAAEEPEGAAAETAPGQPEVIGRKKEEGGSSEEG